MPQNYKVFINNGLIFFGHFLTSPPLGLRRTDFQLVKPDYIKTIVDQIVNHQEVGYYYVETTEPELAFRTFASYFTVMHAAGGLVINDQDELLMIHRFQHWDFPKGKVEKGEEIEQAAIREVMEETGIKEVAITKQIPSTYHIYNYYDKWILKKTYWYTMFSSYKGKLIPQLEEDIVAAKWVPINFLSEYIMDSYAALQDLVDSLNMVP